MARPPLSARCGLAAGDANDRGGGRLVLLITERFVVIPDGAAGVRVSEIGAARPGTYIPACIW